MRFLNITTPQKASEKTITGTIKNIRPRPNAYSIEMNDSNEFTYSAIINTYSLNPTKSLKCLDIGDKLTLTGNYFNFRDLMILNVNQIDAIERSELNKIFTQNHTSITF